MKIELNDKELDYIVKLLMQRPWGEVNALIMNINQQVGEQNVSQRYNDPQRHTGQVVDYTG